jgi:glycine/D-amino acid oxidase-like deaminating enzyme
MCARARAQDVSGPLPEDVDTVIIGAGMTGASVARHVAQLEPERAARTLVLDARGAAGGATGRNGGMCAPMDCYDFGSDIERHGLEEALAERAMQFETMDFQRRFIEAHGVEADLRFDGYMVAWLSSGDVESGERAHETCIEHQDQCGDPYCGLNRALSRPEAIERMQSPDVEGALFQPAGGGLWAARVVFALLEEAISAGVTLRTQTRVLSVDRAATTNRTDTGAEGPLWLVNTDKGPVRARHVVFATNAYTSSLLPEFNGVINPYRNQVVMTAPLPALWSELFWFSSPPAGSSYAYFFQRPDGRIVIGSNAAPGDQLDDSEVSDAVTQRILGASNYLVVSSRVFSESSLSCECVRPCLASDSKARNGAPTAELRETFPALEGVEAEQVWMGVTQWTADGYPWVGPLPSQPGNYIAAGFTEGMVQCFASGHAIAQMLAGNDAPTPFNSRYLPTARGRRPQ